MRRAPLIAAGTIIGAAGVLAFPVQSHLAGSSAATTGSSTSTATASSSPAASPAPATSSSASRSATGADETFRYGDIAVTVTVKAGKITNVTVAQLNENDRKSASIDSYAIPQLEQQVIAANSANIQGVSGATFTSSAFKASTSSALTKLGLSG